MLKNAMVAKRYEPRHFPHLNLGGIWVSKGKWNDALASFEDALRVAPEQPLPSMPTVSVSVPPPTADTPKPPEEALDDLLETMGGYFQAWNTYDPVALVERTAPSSAEAVKALLLQLARAKLERSKILLVDTAVMYFAGPMVILAGIPQIKPTFLEIAPSGIPSNIIPHSKGVKCGLIRSNSPFSYSNHRPAKPKIPKPLVYAQVSPLGTSFATP